MTELHWLVWKLELMRHELVDQCRAGDDVIISGGENISLAQIENLLANKFPNQNFVAVGIPDEKWGSKLCLLSDKDMEISDVSELLSVRIGKHGIPKEFLSPIAIPLKGIGKPDRVAVRQLFLNK